MRTIPPDTPYRVTAGAGSASKVADKAMGAVASAKPKRRQSKKEHFEQVALFQWCEWNRQKYPDLDLLFAIPNGGARNKSTAGMLKAEGVKAGVPDMLLPVPARGMCGLFIEMKVLPNRPSKEQEKWIEALRNKGYRVAVCYSWLEAVEQIRQYLK